MRHLRKKLQQIEALEARAAGGEVLNAQQAYKVAQRPQVCPGSSDASCPVTATDVAARHRTR